MSSGYKCTGMEIAASAGTTSAAAVYATPLWVRRAVVTHKGTGSNLLLGMENGAEMGIKLVPTQSYVFDPGEGFRFDLSDVLAQDEGGATAHAVHILAWL